MTSPFAPLSFAILVQIITSRTGAMILGGAVFIAAASALLTYCLSSVVLFILQFGVSYVLGAILVATVVLAIRARIRERAEWLMEA